MPDDAIDTNDIPEVSDWSRAERGKFYRPVKKPYSLRLDADVVAWFKASGDGYQTRINAALREYVLTHSKKSA
ncbi:BrnA antitoxin family protein [Asticcacaulis sp. EMRT-3]|uniref:BrnA antitoxin family protein n=1 Tax=Asticcacaulis sp. EMRT-3 TaxID=3040349 RepID=UPI0032C23C3B